MKVQRLEDGLAVRLPESIVAALHLKEGDDLAVQVSPDGGIDVRRQTAREEAMQTLRDLRRGGPSDYTFKRSHVYDE